MNEINLVNTGSIRSNYIILTFWWEIRAKIQFQVQNFYLKSSYFNKQTQKLKDENPEMVMEMDIEGFHSFVKYLIAKGPGGNWGSRQRHWRRYMDVCKGKLVSFDHSNNGI